jgi:hypothetical protein
VLKRDWRLGVVVIRGVEEEWKRSGRGVEEEWKRREVEMCIILYVNAVLDLRRLKMSRAAYLCCM